MLLKGASGGGGLAPPFLSLGMSSEEEDDDRLPAKIPDLDAHNPPTDDEGFNTSYSFNLLIFFINTLYCAPKRSYITTKRIVTQRPYC